MGFLAPDKVLPLAGYAVPNPVTDTREGAALAYAEGLIEGRTGLVWGSSGSDTLRVRLNARSYYLPLPQDVSAVVSIQPALMGSETFELDRYGLLRLDSDGVSLPWEEGYYRLELTRGITTIPPQVNRAAALLVADYMSVADADRSKYDNLSLGDFSGTQRAWGFPVPEADQLLGPWCDDVAVSL